MKASEAKFLSFLKKSPQFVIPIYQRTYSWTIKECQQLWEDILRTGRNDKISAHFVGSIVYVEKGIYHITDPSGLLVIDGQQRLTTISLILEALARSLGDSEPVDGFSARKIRNYFLLNPEEAGERRYKLVLSQTDKASLVSLLDQQEKPRDHSMRVEANFAFFKDRIEESSKETEAICKGLAKLVIVDIALSRDQDNPQLIFESLNSTGRELSQADLIRNFILMGLEPGLQTNLYEQHWRPMEIDFGQEAYTTHFDGFMRDYLTVKTGVIPNIREVYDAFKEYSRSPEIDSVEALVSDIHHFAGYYCAMALRAEKDPELKMAFHDIRELKVDVAFPFLLELYQDYANGVLSKEELLNAARMVESYVFRRAVCGIPTNSMNKTFATFSKGLRKDKYLESIQAGFLLQRSYRRFPSDEEFMQNIQTKDLYNFRSKSYWLRRMENFDRKERVTVEEYTIEHILPQNDDLSARWKSDLGEDWERIQKSYLHTIGNLTLTRYNSEYSDRPFNEKRDLKGGFADSPLRLNDGLLILQKWDEQSIKDRALKLAEKATAVWPIPILNASVLQSYKQTGVAATYNIGDHVHLSGSPLRELFEAFRKQMLELDPVVSEEFLKYYIAYKAETNFVDIVPQVKRLRLSLNIPFNEINDPKGLCRDVTGLHHWGNGDTEVGLATQEEIPYIMGLVRQALEKQMGNGGDE